MTRRRRTVELVKFSVVLGVGYIVDVLLFNIAMSFGVGPLPAKALSYSLSAIVSFAGNRRWTWRDREGSALVREYLIYFLITVFSMVTLLAFLGLTHYGLGSLWPELRTPWAANLSANVIGPPLITLFRFWACRRWVFRDAPVPGELSAAGDRVPVDHAVGRAS
jgi:putative flippase GtrA